MPFREPPGSGPGLSQRPNPGRGAGAAFHPSQLLRWDQLRHWERTRKYQWALLGLITHSKGMTSISLDFLGTCLQLESSVPSPAHEAAEQRPGTGEEKGSMGDPGQGTQGGSV